MLAIGRTPNVPRSGSPGRSRENCAGWETPCSSPLHWRPSTGQKASPHNMHLAYIFGDFGAASSRTQHFPSSGRNDPRSEPGGASRATLRPAETSDPERLERLRREELLGLESAFGQPLLVVIPQKGVEHLPIRRETVGPPVIA